MQAFNSKGGKAQNFWSSTRNYRKHFEALRTARKSVTMMDLEKFEQFRRKFDPSFAKSSSFSSTKCSRHPNGLQPIFTKQESKLTMMIFIVERILIFDNFWLIWHFIESKWKKKNEQKLNNLLNFKFY